MISSYKGAIFEIYKILTEAQEEASKHSNAEIRAEILNNAIDKAIQIKRQYFGPFSKPTRHDSGEWHNIWGNDKDFLYCDTDSIKIKENKT